MRKREGDIGQMAMELKSDIKSDFITVTQGKDGAILFNEKNIASNSKERHQESFQNNIVTEISHADVFYKAEEYHQKYILKGNSCAI